MIHSDSDRKGSCAERCEGGVYLFTPLFFAPLRKTKGCFSLTKSRLKSLAVLALLLAAWYLASRSGRWSSYVLPGPEKVAATAWKMIRSGVMARHVLASLRRVALGFGISFCLGFTLSVTACLLPAAAPFYGHLTEGLRHVPPMSLIPLLILWFGIGEVPKIIIIVLTAFYPIYLNTLSGFSQCDARLSEVGASLGFSRGRVFFRILLPGALPSMLAGMRIALGYSWRAIIGAEMIAAASGLGYMILDAQAMSRSDKVIAGILVIGLVGYLTDWLFGLLIRALIRGGHV